MDDFIEVSKEIGRTKEACFKHWGRSILPILKTDILQLPQGVEWMEDFLKYIVANRIVTPKRIPFNQVVKDICPGQTSTIISEFANNLLIERNGTKRVRSKDPLHEICTKRLEKPPVNSYLGSEKKANSKLQYIEKILELKNTILG